MLKNELENMISKLWLDSYAENQEVNRILDENEEKISLLITDEESEILSYLELFKEENIEAIERLFGQDGSRRKLQNLEARGLVRISGVNVSLRKHYGISLYPAFGRRLDEEKRNARIEDFPRALLSYILLGRAASRNLDGGTITKAEKCSELFSFMDGVAISQLMDYIKENITYLGLAENDRNSLDRILAFMNLEYEEMISYMLWPRLGDEDRRKSYRFLMYLRKAGIIREDGFERIQLMAERFSDFYRVDVEDSRYSERITAFLRTSFFEKRDDMLYPLRAQKEEDGRISISSDRLITVYGKTDPRLYLMTEPMKIDQSKLLELSKESIGRLFRFGYTANDVYDILSSMTQYPIPEMVTTLLKFWYDDFRRLRISRSIVMRTDEKYAERFEKMFSSIIEEKVSPTCFILSVTDENEIRRMLPQSLQESQVFEGPEFKETEKIRSQQDFLRNTEAALLPEEIPQDRKYPYRKSRKDELISRLDSRDKALWNIRVLMINSGILFDETQLGTGLPFSEADAFHYGEKSRLLSAAQKDRDYCVQVENHSGQSTIGGVSMVQDYEEGDHTIIGKKMLSVSRLYKVRLIPRCFL